MGYEGTARGGPFDGQPLISRYPGGVLVVDRPTNRAWVYDYHPGSQTFQVRADAPEPLSEQGRFKAATEFIYDVRTLP